MKTSRELWTSADVAAKVTACGTDEQIVQCRTRPETSRPCPAYGLLVQLLSKSEGDHAKRADQFRDAGIEHRAIEHSAGEAPCA